MSLLHIYVDGSCLGNQNVDDETPAGWGVVIISGSNDLGRGNGEIVHEFSGRVITNPDSDEFIGAEVGSNNTAELTAMAQALRWVLVEGNDSEIIIKTDSQYAGNQTTGAWKTKANKSLVKYVQGLWSEVSGLRKISWQHVRAHRGHRWNERADHLAIRAANDEVPLGLSFWKPGQR
jgi:ribonuclease HI